MHDQIREKGSQILERAGLLVLLSLPSAGQIFAVMENWLLHPITMMPHWPCSVAAQSRCQSAAQLAFTLQWMHVVHLMHVTHSAGKTDLRQPVVFLETQGRTQRSTFANPSLLFVNPKMFSLCSCQELRHPIIIRNVTCSNSLWFVQMNKPNGGFPPIF